MEENGQIRVAVIGSGMAGLVTAYLLNQDVHSRYAVTIFERDDVLSLDSASLSIPNPTKGTSDRIDLPMRAFAGGFYNQLRGMYDYLGVEYHAQPFLFKFCKVSSRETASTQKGEGTSYFIHSSNNHRIPPVRPEGIRTTRWLLEILYLLLCYTYFSFCCFLVAPFPASEKELCEALDAYLHRIRLPKYFVTDYLLPLMSSVTTCSPTKLLAFPAVDVVEYKKRTHGAPHYTVTNGVQDVQRKLAKGLDTRLSAMITAVEPTVSGVRVRWKTSTSTDQEELFDRVILAVSPDVIGRIFEPLSHVMARIPTVSVDSIIHTDGSHIGSLGAQNTTAQTIHLRTSTSGTHLTESIHVQPSGALVTTCPISPIDPTQIIKRARFTRVLRTAESRRIVNSIFGDRPHQDNRRLVRKSYDYHEKNSVTGWKNGDDGVWLAGGWCWDGMVLLEGCVVSAMRVAHAFGVEVPWRDCGVGVGNEVLQACIR